MGRDTSPYIVGDFWLDKRRDGKSPDVWQIARYDAKARSDVYRSTKQRDLAAAKAVIDTFFEVQRAKGPQTAEDAKVIPQLLLYYREHGQEARKPAQIASSLRVWIGFLMQDIASPDVTFAQVDKPLLERFRRWRMGEHSYSVPWRDKVYNHSSTGVSGETVQRNLDDFRAALNYAEDANRVPHAPKVAGVKQEYRSPPRDVHVTLEQLGAMVAFTRADIGTHRWIQLMIASMHRPDACLAFDPAKQDRGALLDMHPPEWPRTKKRNQVIPCITPFRSVLNEWGKKPHKAALSKKRAWTTMRRALGLAEEVVPKTIRHTIAKELRSRGVPGEEIEMMLGHRVMKRVSEVYAKYDPAYLANARDMLTTIYLEVQTHAEAWDADHLRTTPVRGKPITVDKRRNEAQSS